MIRRTCTLSQAQAVVCIYRRLGRSISFEEAIGWDCERASKLIGTHYLDHYQVKRLAQ